MNYNTYHPFGQCMRRVSCSAHRATQPNEPDLTTQQGGEDVRYRCQRSRPMTEERGAGDARTVHAARCKAGRRAEVEDSIGNARRMYADGDQVRLDLPCDRQDLVDDSAGLHNVAAARDVSSSGAARTTGPHRLRWELPRSRALLPEPTGFVAAVDDGEVNSRQNGDRANGNPTSTQRHAHDPRRTVAYRAVPSSPWW
jgi:hypothetical protein